MKLSEPQIKQVVGQTGATVIAQDHPAISELESNFGEHTFFLDDEGLHVWERPSGAEQESKKLVRMRVAAWGDEAKSSLVPHEPLPTQVLQDSK